MFDFKYEIGDQFRTSWGSSPLTILGRARDEDGILYYWVTNSRGIPTTYQECNLDSWIRIGQFFEAGDWWIDDSNHRYEVTHVDSDLKSAWVIATSPEDDSHRESFGEFTWRIRKDQILENRKG